MNQLPAEVFKAYDIRGIVGKSLTADQYANNNADGYADARLR